MSSAERMVFVCYSHADVKWLNGLKKMLQPVHHALKLWSDRDIRPGQLWLKEIRAAIDAADMALLLVSDDFLASEFITRIELPSLLELERTRGLPVMWVPVSACIYEGTEIGRYQAVWDPKCPLEEIPNHKRRSVLRGVAATICRELESSVRDRRRATSTDNNTRRPGNLQTFGEAPDRGTIAVSGVEVHYRHESESSGADVHLQTAHRALFIALTFRTLRLALTEGIKGLPALRDVELAVYALPIVQEWHPTLRGRRDQLAQEWIAGLHTAITTLSSPGYCPGLENLDIRLINRVPTFTASIVTTSDSLSQTRIRYTAVLEGEEPSATPTITILSCGTEPNPMFVAYTRIVNNLRSNAHPLLFPVIRDGKPRYGHSRFGELVERLATVCNHPSYAPADQLYRVHVRIGHRLGEKLKGSFLANTTAEVSPDVVYRAFVAIRDAGETYTLRVSFDFVRHSAVLTMGVVDGEAPLEADVEGRHLIGVFALMTHGSGAERTVVLKHKAKPPWPYDVPGGKVASVDASPAAALSREVFEELGLLLDDSRMSDVISVKYDPRSRKEGTPVIALYCRYELSDAESLSIEAYPEPDGEAADVGPLVFYRVNELIQRKRRHRETLRRDVDDFEAECHAPLEAIEALTQRDK